MSGTDIGIWLFIDGGLGEHERLFLGPVVS